MHVEFGYKMRSKKTSLQEVLHADEGIILKWILKKFDGVWTGLIWLRIGIDRG
jgi:hypothetical protein